mgnify:CR=1 FL=1
MNKEEQMFHEIILTTTLCVAIFSAMALFYGELLLLQHAH